jgi:hypothetical protein
MSPCLNCDHEVPSTAKFCPKCGANMTTVSAGNSPTARTASGRPPKPTVPPPTDTVADFGRPAGSTGAANPGQNSPVANANVFGAVTLMSDFTDDDLQMRHKGERRFYETGANIGGVLFRLFILPLLAFLVLAVPAALLLAILALATGSGEVMGLATIILILVPAITFVVVLCIPIRELISDWNLTLEDRAQLADSAFAGTYESLIRRHTPALITTRRVKSLATATAINDFVIVERGRFSGYLAMLPFGKDLYMSWTLWHKQYLLGMFFRMIAEALFGRDDLRRSMQTEPARAMREAIHLSMKEGVQNAVDGVPADLQATFGEALAPIESPQEVGPTRVPGSVTHA